MLPYAQIQAQLNEAENVRRAAERDYATQQAVARATPRRWYCCLLTRFGQKLVTAGQRLQAHYGEAPAMRPLPKLSH
jgi:hypothetical protein